MNTSASGHLQYLVFSRCLYSVFSYFQSPSNYHLTTAIIFHLCSTMRYICWRHKDLSISKVHSNFGYIWASCVDLWEVVFLVDLDAWPNSFLCVPFTSRFDWLKVMTNACNVCIFCDFVDIVVPQSILHRTPECLDRHTKHPKQLFA
jgi:hypothetical protein